MVGRSLVKEEPLTEIIPCEQVIVIQTVEQRNWCCTLLLTRIYFEIGLSVSCHKIFPHLPNRSQSIVLFALGPRGMETFHLWLSIVLLWQHEQMDDTSASDYKKGKDIQGIPWERLNYSRDQYRKMRLKEYKNYQNLTRSRSGLEQVIGWEP